MKTYLPDDWHVIKERFSLLWENEILDRPIVSVQCDKDSGNRFIKKRPWKNETLKEYYLDTDCILERNIDKFEKTYYAGDAFPVIFPFWGCSGHMKYWMSKNVFDRNVQYTDKSIWIEPFIEEDEYENREFVFNENNPIFQEELRAMSILAQEGKGKFLVSLPDNCGSYDGVAAARGSEDFLMDMIVDPENVKLAGNKMVDTLIASGNAFFETIKENNFGGSSNGWYGTWSPGRHMQLQCDLSVMISPEKFREYIVEELERTTDWLDHSIYHFDGIEQTRFLDMILSIPKLNMIQWTQCEGQPDVTHNFHHIRRIQEAGKGLVLLMDKSILDAVINNTSPYGRHLVVSGAKDPKEADEIVEYVTKHSFYRKYY